VLRKIIHISLGALLLAALLSGCGKHRKSFMARNWHSFLSYFNGYYNGNVKFREGARETEKKFTITQDDWMPIFAWETDPNSTASGLFDEAIKKCDVVIYRHPYGKWIDDCRYLNGKCNFYKHNSATAILNFEYLIAAFPKSDLVPETKVWLAKAYYLSGYPDKALNFCEKNLKKSQLPKNLRGEVAALETRLYIEKEKYDKAETVLAENIESIPGRKQKARGWYLLGQLYAKNNKYAKAYEGFTNVIKLNTDYALVFNARLQLVRLIANQPSLANRSAEINRLLKELLRDEKNKDFLDQIYYEFAMLEIRKPNYDKALSYLQKSLDVSTTNTRQKSLSYYKSGSLYFHEKENYPQAQLYFDSAASLVKEDAPEYKEVKSMSAILKEYVVYYETLTYQDSMLKLAGMPSAKRDQLIDKLIKDDKRRKENMEDSLRLLEENQEMTRILNQQQQLNSNNTLASSAFSFDDPKQSGAGKIQFQKIWGNRKNEDNWRRSQKIGNSGNSSSDEKTKENKTSSQEDPEAIRKKYYRDIPLTDEEKKVSNEKIDLALFGIAQIYHKKLNLPEKAIPYYERLIKRYPESVNFLKSQYALYTIYKDLKSPKANNYKNYILNQHPNSLYARLIRSQSITDELRKSEQTFDGAYSALFQVYSVTKDYQTVIDFCNYILETFPEKPKFPAVLYMKGLSFGKMGNIDSMRYMYKYLIDNYPEAESTPIAKRTLELLDGSKSAGSTPPQTPPKISPNKDNLNSSLFTPTISPGDEVIVLFIVENNKLNINELKIKFSNLHGEKYASENLTMTGVLYRQQYVSIISKFINYRFAWKYIQELKSNSQFNTLPKNPGKDIVFITRKNFNTCIQKNMLEEYISYFEKNHIEMLAGK